MVAQRQEAAQNGSPVLLERVNQVDRTLAFMGLDPAQGQVPSQLSGLVQQQELDSLVWMKHVVWSGLSSVCVYGNRN